MAKARKKRQVGASACTTVTAPSKQRGFRVGDRVEILNYKREIAWGNRTPQRYGFITSINGEYILIRPRWQKHVLERYPNEIRHA